MEDGDDVGDVVGVAVGQTREEDWLGEVVLLGAPESVDVGDADGIGHGGRIELTVNLVIVLPPL